jgi:hypothetical protein
MTDLPDDPHSERVGLYGQIIKNGKLIPDALDEQQHYATATAAIEALSHEELAHLALTIAAEAALTRSEQAGDGDIWLDWWRGVDSGGEPDTIDTSPGIMRRTLRPDPQKRTRDHFAL